MTELLAVSVGGEDPHLHHHRCIMSDVNAGELHKLASVLRSISAAATADPGERPQAVSTVAIVEDVAAHPDSCIGDIAERTGLAQSLVSTTVAKLKDRGVFTTAPDPADRRRTVVTVQPGAVAAFGQRGARPVTDALASALPGATADQREGIEAALTHLAGWLLPATAPRPTARR